MLSEVKAKFDYNSGHEDDLSFTAGQVIKVTEEVDDEWYNGEYLDNQGNIRQGMFPRNFVVPIPPRGTDTNLSTFKREATEAALTVKHPEHANIENQVTSAPAPPIVEASSKPAQTRLAPSSNVKSDIRVPVREGQTSQQGVLSCMVSSTDARMSSIVQPFNPNPKSPRLSGIE